MGAAKFRVVIYGNTLEGTGAHPLSLVSTPVCHLQVTVKFLVACWILWPIPVTTRSKVWFCGLPLAETAGSNSANGIAVSLL